MAEICGLYIGGETLSLLSLKSTKKGWMIESGGVEIHSAGETDDLSQPIKTLCKSLKIPRREVTVVLPKQQAILRNVQLPSTERDELVQMARFEAERHIPFHAERHSTGFHVMRSMGVEGSEVVLGAVDGPVVQRVLDGTVGAGLTPRGVNLSSVCLVNSLIFEKQEWIKGKTIAILAMGLDTLDLVLIADGRLLFARSVTLDLRSVLEAWIGFQASTGNAVRPEMAKLAMAARMVDCTNLEGHYSQPGAASTHEEAELVRGWIDRLMQELRRTHDFARREMKCPPIDAVAITGEGAILRNLGQYLYVNLNAEVQTLNPVGTLAGAEAQKFPFEGLELVIPFGGAIAGELEAAYRLDLTPSEYYRQVSRKRTLRRLLLTVGLILVALGLGAVGAMRFGDIRQRQVAAYEAENVKMKPEAAALQEMKAKLAIIQRFISDRNSALVLLGSIAGSNTIPGQVALTSIGYEKGKVVTIEGESKSIPDINSFIQDLRSSGHFANVAQQGDPAPSTGIGNQVYYTFKVECSLEAPPMEKGTDKKASESKEDPES